MAQWRPPGFDPAAAFYLAGRVPALPAPALPAGRLATTLNPQLRAHSIV